MKHAIGIEIRHGRACAARDDGECSCKPTFQASVWSARDKRRIRKTFATPSAAKAWRQDAIVGLRRGTMRAPSSTTVREAAEALIAGAKDGSIRNRSGDAFKPSVCRGYEQGLRDRILPELGACKLSDVRRADVQDLADRMLAAGVSPSTLRNAIAPLRVIYRRALARGEVAVNPCAGLELPAARGRRDRIASPEEAATLIQALPEADRALWATAMYAGLRAGELGGLEWADVDLAGGVIRVERSWDPGARRMVEPKSRAGRRSVPIPAVLRGYLLEHKLRSGRSEGLVFGRSAAAPFTSSNVWRRAHTAWKRLNVERVKQDLEPLEPIGLHESRHTFASLMIGAGVNAKALSTYVGHSSISITLDRYGHLLPGNEDEAAALLDAYLERADTAARLAQVGTAES
jgi:integrase